MSDIEGIKEINSGNALHKRALAYCANNPGVGFADALVKLAKRDAQNAKVRKSLNKAKEGKPDYSKAKPTVFEPQSW